MSIGSPAAGPAPAALDATALARLHELDPDGRHGVVQRVLSAFEASLARLLVQLRDASATRDAAVVVSVAHTLKSSSASIGALALAATCTEVERRLRDGDTSRLDDDLQRLLADGEATLQVVGAALRR